MRVLKLGTRGSKLALWQANAVAKAIGVVDPKCRVEVITIVTQGDRAQGQDASSIYRDKRDWVKEIEESLLREEIDLAVHSAKDVPEKLAQETEITAVLKRESAHDVLICKDSQIDSYSALAAGALIGSSSLRRVAQLKRLRPDFAVVEHGGNVPNRIEKLRQHSTMSAIVLAAAGIRRLEMGSVISQEFSYHEMLPAAGQGVLAAQYRKGEQDVASILDSIKDTTCFTCWSAERSFVVDLGADCNSAVGAFAELSRGEVKLVGRILSPDGAECIGEQIVGKSENSVSLGKRLAEKMLSLGAERLLRMQ